MLSTVYASKCVMLINMPLLKYVRASEGEVLTCEHKSKE